MTAERSPRDPRDFPRQMERFLMVDRGGGVDTYFLQRNHGISIPTATWFGLFTSERSSDPGNLAGGELNGNLPMAITYAKLLIYGVRIPQDRVAEDATFSVGDNPNPPALTHDSEMPIAGILFLPEGLVEPAQSTILRTVSKLGPENALSMIRDAIDSSSEIKN